MKRKYFITVLTDDGQLACAGEFEALTITEAIEQAEQQGAARYPGRRLFTTHAALQEFGGHLRWLRRGQNEPWEAAA